MIRNNRVFLSACLFAVLLVPVQAIADYIDSRNHTASSYQDVYDILNMVEDEQHDELGGGMAHYSGSTVINGQAVNWVSDYPYAHMYVNGKYIATWDDTLVEGTPRFLSEERRIIGLITQTIFSSVFANPSSPVSATARTAEVVFDKLVMPSATTRRAKEMASARKARHMTRVIAGSLRYANVEQHGSDGDVIGCDIGMAHDFENITIGAIMPYDYLDFDNFFDANRIGLILFSQYSHDISKNLSAVYTGNINYLYTDVDYSTGGNDEINTYGGGLGTSLTLDQNAYVVSMALSYQFSREDIDSKDNYHHLVKLGANAGYRIGQDLVVTVFGICNKDITDYEYSCQDDLYFDLGTETTMNLGDTFAVTVGYKKVLGLDNYESDVMYLGSMFRF